MSPYILASRYITQQCLNHVMICHVQRERRSALNPQDIAQGPVVQNTISTNPRLPINQWFWIRLFWLKNLDQISQLKSLLYTLEIC